VSGGHLEFLHHFEVLFLNIHICSLYGLDYFFLKDGMFSNWTTGLSHLRYEVIFDQLFLKKDSQVIKF
jgi:hypothetical protein